MDYIFTFLEGIASFISPCLLPMLPIYISYFIGEDDKKTAKAVVNSIGFVLGFTIVFLILSIFASQLGRFVSRYINYIKIVFGIIIILLGLNYMEIFKIKILNKSKGIKANTKDLNFIKAIIFGIIGRKKGAKDLGTAGMIIGIIVTVLILIIFCLVIAFIVGAFKYYY